MKIDWKVKEWNKHHCYINNWLSVTTFYTFLRGLLLTNNYYLAYTLNLIYTCMKSIGVTREFFVAHGKCKDKHEYTFV